MTMYSNNTAKSVWTKVRLSFLSYFSSKMIFFPSTVPSVPSFFCLLCFIPSPFISFFIQSLIRSFVLCLFYPSCVFLLFVHTLFSAYSFLLYFNIYSLYGCLSLFLASHPPLILPFVTTLTYFFVLWLLLYRACSKITQLLIPTHAHFHWLKFIKNI